MTTPQNLKQPPTTLSVPAKIPQLPDRGMALLLSLAILTGLSLLSVLAASSMLQQRQMASNHTDSQLAQALALRAVTGGEQYVLGLPADARTTPCTTDCFKPPYDQVLAMDDHHSLTAHLQADSWWLAHGNAIEGDQANVTGLSRIAPLFLVEELKYLPWQSTGIDQEAPVIEGIAYYRVLGRGAGKGAHSSQVLESILARPWQGTADETKPPINCERYRPWFDCGRMAFRVRR